MDQSSHLHGNGLHPFHETVDSMNKLSKRIGLNYTGYIWLKYKATRNKANYSKILFKLKKQKNLVCLIALGPYKYLSINNNLVTSKY